VVFRNILGSFTFITGSFLSRESGLRVGDVNTTITSTLENTKDSVSGCGSHQTSIKNSLEWLSLLDIILNIEVSTINLGLTNVLSV